MGSGGWIENVSCVYVQAFTPERKYESKFYMTSLNQFCFFGACFMIFGCQEQAVPPSCCWWGCQHGHTATLHNCSSCCYIPLPSPQCYLEKEWMEKEKKQNKTNQPTKRTFWGPSCVTSIFASCWGRFARALRGGKVQVRGRKLLTPYRRRL